MHSTCPIAIVGLGGVFPRAATPAALWDNVVGGVDAVRDVPPERWILDPADVLGDGAHPDTVPHGRAAYVEGFSLDPRGLHVDPAALSALDPLYHFVLRAGRDAIEDAGAMDAAAWRTGVVLAAIALPTDGSSAWTRAVLGGEIERALRQKLGRHAAQPVNTQEASRTDAVVGHGGPTLRDVGRGGSAVQAVGRGGSALRSADGTSLPAALLARALGLGGGAMTLDAACASSLYAIKLACDALQAGRADAMLAGGVSRPECLYTQMGFGLLGALSPRGACRPFDAAADGLIVGEGCGVVVLRRLEDAVRDRQRVYGVIRGIGVSNDVAGSLLAADSEGQLRAMRAAYEQAGLAPRDIDFMECHGTGTPQGDAVELRSLARLLEGAAADASDAGAGGRMLRIGSIKSQIGHLLTAAGAAGLIKTVLGMRAGVLPPQIHFERFGRGFTPHPLLRVQSEPEPWTRRSDTCPRRAAVSAFGFGGINAHLLLEEFLPDRADAAVRAARPPKQSMSGGAPAGPAATAADSAGEDYVPPAFRRRTPAPADAAHCPSDEHAIEEPIAIVGMAAHLGAAESLDAFAEALFGGRSIAAGDVSGGSERFAGRSAPAARIASLCVPVGDFKLPPNEIPEVLPQQTLMLMVAAAALADVSSERGGRIAPGRALRSGALIGMALDPNTSNYHLRWWMPELARRLAHECGLALADAELREWAGALRDACGPPLNATRVLGSLGSTIASRIAREYGFGGPSYAVSAGAASGPRALECALDLLRRLEADLMLVGAVDLCCDVRTLAARAAPGDVPFDTTAGGATRTARDARAAASGEGACALVLKRLADARRDGDRVYAVIRSVNCAAPQDGPVANGASDRAAAPARRGVTASAASVAGDCGAAGGLLDVVAAALALDQRVIPPGFRPPAAGPEGQASPSGARPPVEAEPWLRNRAEGPRRALAQSCGDDGGGVAVILEEAPGDAPHRKARRFPGSPAPAAFALLGESAAALLGGLDDLRRFIETSEGPLAALAASWHESHARGRSAAPLAVVVVAASKPEAVRAIDRARAALRARPDEPLRGQDGTWYSPRPLRQAQLCFVYPGSGSHYAGMGRGLALAWPGAIDALDAECARLADQFSACWREPPAESQARNGRGRGATDVCGTIIAQVSFGILMTDVLARLAVRPAAALGYSLGETTSLFALRVWRDRDRMFERMKSSPLFRWELAGECEAARRAWGEAGDAAIDWRVVVVNRDAAEVRPALASRPRAHLLIVNAPGECVIGGARPDVDAVVAELGCQAAVVEGASSVHCPIVRQVERAYRDLHRLPATPPAGVRFYSAAAAAPYEPDQESAAQSITEQALHGFDFTRLIERAYKDGLRAFVEVGPQASCTRMIARILAGRPHLALSASAADDEAGGVVRLLAALVAERIVPDLGGLFGAPAGENAPNARQAGESFAVERPASQRVVVVPAHLQTIDPPVPKRCSAMQGEVCTGGAAFAAAPARVDSVAAHSGVNLEPPRPWSPGGAQTAWPDDAALGAQLVASAAATGDAHEAFLRFTQESMQATAQLVAGQLRMLEALNGAELLPSMADLAPPPPCVFDREQCLEFARGSAARVLGPMFAELDSFAVRVRLPDEPLMLVDRITSLQGAAGALGAGTITTEHDVLPGAWYLDGGRMPVCVAVESGQADLFLCSYLGIDLRVRGTRAYRLLDATVRFHRELPRPGETIRYDIAIDRFVRQGEAWLFFFRFDATIAGRPLMSMRNGCAGFFTREEIENSRGIVLTADEQGLASSPGATAQGGPARDGKAQGGTALRAAHSPRDDGGSSLDEFHPAVRLVPVARETYNEAALDALRRGEPAECFGPAFAGLGLRRPLGLPGGRMRLLHRVVELDPLGGRWGLGKVVGEADIHPDDWFLTCHFVDDMVMPGTLMFECCAHTLRVLLLRLGWVGEDGEAGYEPLPERRCVLKCRGPVTPATRVVTYEVHVKEIGYWSHERAQAEGLPESAARLVAAGEPYVVADAWMYADGKRIVQFSDMSLRVSGLTQAKLEAMWRRDAGPPRASGALAGSRTPPGPAASVAPIGGVPVADAPKPALYGADRILAFSIGRPSDAFGDAYRAFDAQRRVARLPGPPYLVLDRITEIHAAALRLAPGGWIEAQYDVPRDAWYFAANRQRAMPFAILLEIALQPCGWFAAYLGSALRSRTDLRFRNLGGAAVLHREVLPDAGTLTTRVSITDVTEAGGMIIEKFDMQVWRGRQIVYDGNTYFGFFSDEALSNQVGVRGAAARRLGATTASAGFPPLRLDARPDEVDAALGCGASGQMPEAALRMIEQIDCLALRGGPGDLGFASGRMRVDPGAWFFKAHFHQDPVVPGSLGCESLLQLLKAYALRRWGAAERRFETIAVGARHEWTYRGQIVPRNREIEVEAVVTRVEDGDRPAAFADGLVVVDGTVIYELKNFGVRMVTGESGGRA